MNEGVAVSADHGHLTVADVEATADLIHHIVADGVTVDHPLLMPEDVDTETREVGASHRCHLVGDTLATG